MQIFRAVFLTTAAAAFFMGVGLLADNVAFQQGRRSSLQQEYAQLQAARAQAERALPQVMAGGSVQDITSLNRQIEAYDARLAQLSSQMGVMRNSFASPSFKNASAATTVPSFTATPGSAGTTIPPSAQTMTSPRATTTTTIAMPGSANAALSTTRTTTPPAIEKVNDGLSKLDDIREWRSSTSSMRRRGTSSVGTSLGGVNLQSAQQELARQAGGAAMPSNIQSSTATIPARRAIRQTLSQQQAIGAERAEVARQLSQAEIERAALERMNQSAQVQAVDQQINALRQRGAAATAESANVSEQANAIADAIAKAKKAGDDEDLDKPKESGGLIQLRGMAAGTDDGTFKAGDTARIVVAEDSTFNDVYEVDGRGILVPDIGRINILGMDEETAENAIKAVLEKTILRVASVSIKRTAAVRDVPPEPGYVAPPEEWDIIYLAGEFITPGPLRIPSGVVPTLLQTIIRSGGITPSGDLTKVKLLRLIENVGHVEEINVAAILSGEITPVDLELQDGDIIVIPPFAPVVYVTGNVERPGTLRLFQDETLTAYAAILRAGGFARFANLRKVFVVRDLGNGEKAHIPINIKDIQKGKAPDVILQGKDIVVVPERFFSF